MKAKLTKEFVDRLEPDPDPKKRLTVWDTELAGFGVTVTPPGVRGGGVKSYIVQYRPGGSAKTRRVTIGRHGPEWQPKAAREEAAEILRMRRKGIDPFEERARQRLAEQQAQDEAGVAKKIANDRAYNQFSERFIAEYAKTHQPRSWEGTERALRDIGRLFSNRRVDELKRDEIRIALAKLVERSPSAGIAAHKALRKLYNWANAETIFTWNPMKDMPAPAETTVRDRVLSGPELKIIWRAALAMGYPFGTMFQLQLATGLRIRDVANRKWGQFQLDNEAILIPAAEMKRPKSDKRGDFLVPLNEYAMRVVEILPRIAPPAGTVIAEDDRPMFTSKGVKPVAGFSAAKADLDAMVEEVHGSPLPHWTSHDFRRTMATVMQALGIASSIIDRLQDHRDRDLSKTALHYQHWDFFEEKCEAAERYGEYLCGVLDDDPRYVDQVRKVEFRLRQIP